MTGVYRITRTSELDLSTRGELRDPDGVFICFTLERGLKNPDHVRIPAATYTVLRKGIGASKFDKDFGVLIGKSYKGILWLPTVPGRSNIEIHTANYYSELLGCIALGSSIGMDASRNFMITGGTSRPAYRAAYLQISAAVSAGLTQLQIVDVLPVPVALVA